MKQSNNNKKSRDVTAFLYERLSRDDNMGGESYSIGILPQSRHSAGRCFGQHRHRRR